MKGETAMNQPRLLLKLMVVASMGLCPSLAQERPIPLPGLRTVPRPIAPPQDRQMPASLGGPTLGFILDNPSNGIRPILGLPGASHFGELLGGGLMIRSFAASPRQGYILATTGEDRAPVLIREAGSELSIRTPEGMAAGVDRLVLSPRGTAAALYYRDANRVSVISGLPAQAAPAGEFDLSVLRGAPGPMAVSDDGKMLLIASAGADSGVLYLASNGEAPRPVWNLRNVAAVEFIGLTDNALVADGEENRLYLFREVGGSLQVSLLADEKDGIASPRAVAASEDGRRAIVASDLSRSVVVIDLDGGPPRALTCSCTPVALNRLQGNAVFQLTEYSSEPMWVLDGDAAEPRLVFVPPASEGPIRRAAGGRLDKEDVR
jgi:hypothetical protein